MRQPQIIATLVKPSGERIVAKEKTALQEIEQLQQQIEKRKQDAMDELEGDLREAKKVVKDIEAQMAELAGKKTRKARAEGGERVCSVCGEKGHNARRHSKEEVAASKRKKKETAA